jgi:CobQ-like glutamine amidotransferase family enzyme
MSEKRLNIAWMYPDTLYLHGERGNIMALVRYAMELGLQPHVRRIYLGSGGFDPMDYDILFYGPGEISSFRAVMDDIGTYKRTIAEYIASDRILISTGATTAMFGEKITRFSPDAEDGFGDVMEGLCVIPAQATEREYIFGDDLDIRAEYAGYSMELIGNQIHMADIQFSESGQYKRFGTVIYGRGNNGADGMEGVVHGNSIFTNMLGPMLVGNPWLTLKIIRTAAENKGISIHAKDPECELELKSMTLKKQFIEAKKEQQSQTK